mgnify:CR=1 FL=1
MMVRFEEDEYIAVAIFDAGDRIQTMNAMDEIFSYLDEDMKYLIQQFRSSIILAMKDTKSWKEP